MHIYAYNSYDDERDEEVDVNKHLQDFILPAIALLEEEYKFKPSIAVDDQSYQLELRA